MSDTENPTGEQPGGETKSADEQEFDKALAQLGGGGEQIADVTTGERRRHTLAAGQRNFLTETYTSLEVNPENPDGPRIKQSRDITVVADIDEMYLASVVAREHVAARSERRMLAVTLDVVVKGKWGTLRAGTEGNDPEVVWHPLFTDPAFTPLGNTQWRIRGQQFVQFAHTESFLQLLMAGKEAGMVVNTNPRQRPGRKTRDKVRAHANDPVEVNALELSHVEVVINPNFGVDDEGRDRDPFVSFMNGLDDQASRFLADPVVRNVLFINGMTTINEDGSIVPKSADIGIMTTADGTTIRLYGAEPTTEDEIRDLFADFLPGSQEQSAPAQVGALQAGAIQVSQEAAQAAESGETQHAPLPDGEGGDAF